MTASVAARLGGRVRRHSGALLMLLTLAGFACLWTVFAPRAGADDDPAQASVEIRQGQALFNEGCITCHGRNGQGIQGRGPSLIGTGAAATEFQVGTGRMPLKRQEAQASQKTPQYNAEETQQLAAYVQTLGGGPVVPEGDLRDGDLVEGGRLFRLNCAQCHTYGLNGGALSSGKYAPSVAGSSERQIYAAMLTGPQNMPVFGDNELTPEEKRAVINYIRSQAEDQDPGGLNLGRLGPVSEGLVVFTVGLTSLLVASLWIAGKS